MTSPRMKQNFRPQMSVSLLPGIIRAAIVSVNNVMVVWIPVTDVSRSSAIVLIATFMLDPAKLQMNWARASGSTTARAALAVLTPPVRELVMGGPSRAAPLSDCSTDSGRRPLLPVQGRVEAGGGVDQRQVRERLGEVADLFPGQGDLLGVQPHVVGVGEHLLEGRPCVLHPAGAGEGVDVGEGAEREGAFGAP